MNKEIHQLRCAKLVRELERSWREACERGRFRLVHYSIQGDHVHLIVEASSSRDLACGMKSIAARFGRAVNRVLHRAGRVLADRCHVHVLRTPREVRNAIAYVLLNSRRHFRKRTGRPPGAAVSIRLLRAGGSTDGLEGCDRPGKILPSRNPAAGS